MASSTILIHNTNTRHWHFDQVHTALRLRFWLWPCHWPRSSLCFGPKPRLNCTRIARSVPIISNFNISYSTIYGIHMHQLILLTVKAKLLDCEWLGCLGHDKANSSSARCSGCSGSSTGTLCSLQFDTICACMLELSRMHMNACKNTDSINA